MTMTGYDIFLALIVALFLVAAIRDKRDIKG